MVSTSGSSLLDTDAVNILIQRLFPMSTIVTPNIPEAKELLRSQGVPFKEPETVHDIVDMAKAIQGLGPKYVLLKGGHLPLTSDRRVSNGDNDRKIVLNVLYGEGKTTLIESEYLHSKNTHGTGCSLACKQSFPSLGSTVFHYILTRSAAIACNLALGMDMITAVRKANKYVEAGIRTSKDLGNGHGPINHFHSTYTLPFAP